MVADLQRASENLHEGQRRIRQIKGVAWSPDRHVKAVVGPRGQLIELEIDPRIYRTPNSKALAATILDTVRSAVEDVMRQGREIRDEMIPKDLRQLAEQSGQSEDLLELHDADLEGRDG
jgi:DNA-binding protein YbaB